MTRVGRAALVIALLAGAVHAQPNATQVYRVKPKDTLDLIAAELYGDRQYAIFIVAENKLKDRRVAPYTRLRVPVTREITTAKGETFESLAQTHLGDARRAPVLADYNNLDVVDTPATGMALNIPIQISHTAQGNESLGQIATMYLDDAKQGDFLRRYNFLDKASLEKGETILVPVMFVRPRGKANGLDAEAKVRRDARSKAMSDATAILPAANVAWLQGDFVHVKQMLAPLLEQLDFIDTRLVVQIGLMLGKTAIAFGDSTGAAEAFGRVLDRKPSHKLTAYGDSPKVLEAWKNAGGQVAE